MFVNDKNLYNLLKSYEDIISSSLNYGDSIINECLFPSPKVSPDEMGKVAITSVREHLDFANTAFIYHTLHEYDEEDSWDDENSYILTEKVIISLANALNGSIRK